MRKGRRKEEKRGNEEGKEEMAMEEGRERPGLKYQVAQLRKATSTTT